MWTRNPPTSQVMRSCRSDGVLLKPDRPLLPIDNLFVPGKTPGGELGWTESALPTANSTWNFRYILSAELERGYDLMVEEVGLNPTRNLARNFHTGELRWMSGSLPVLVVKFFR